MGQINSFTYELTQSVNTPCFIGDSIEASFLTKGSAGVNAHASQSIDLFYSTTSASGEDQTWERISGDFPKAFSVPTSYVTRSFVAGLSNDAQALKLVITGSVHASASYRIPTGDSGERLGLKIKYDELSLKVHTPKTELTDEGLLVWTSPSRYIKADKDGVINNAYISSDWSEIKTKARAGHEE